ncbi:MAG: hypothetical protein PVI52_03095, partial [Chromatiales bacterium]
MGEPLPYRVLSNPDKTSAETIANHYVQQSKPKPAYFERSEHRPDKLKVIELPDEAETGTGITIRNDKSRGIWFPKGCGFHNLTAGQSASHPSMKPLPLFCPIHV